jgi:hypothetical protein
MTATAVIAPSASSRKMRASTRSRPASERRTVNPEKKTVLPAVAVVVVTARLGSTPRTSSSRKRLTINNA